MQQRNFRLGRRLQEVRVDVKCMAQQTWLVTSAKECLPSLNPLYLLPPHHIVINRLKIRDFVLKFRKQGKQL